MMLLPVGSGYDTASCAAQMKMHRCLDTWMQDQVIIFMALARGRSAYTTGNLTLHSITAITVVESLTPARFKVGEPSTAHLHASAVYSPPSLFLQFANAGSSCDKTMRPHYFCPFVQLRCNGRELQGDGIRVVRPAIPSFLIV